MWEKINYHKNKIYAIILVSVTALWICIPMEELDDPYIISVEYDCRAVKLGMPDVPRIVIEECSALIDNQRKDNELTANKQFI